MNLHFKKPEIEISATWNDNSMAAMLPCKSNFCCAMGN